MAVVAWYLPKWADDDEDLDRLLAIDRFSVLGRRFDGLAGDIEWNRDDLGAIERSHRLVNLSDRLRRTVGGDPLGAIVMPPVITDENGLVLAESNAVIDYILDMHPESPLRPAPGEAARVDYLFWFHAGVGSLMPMQFFNGLLTMMKARSPALVRSVIGLATDKVREMLVAPRLKVIFDKLESDLGRNTWLAGDRLTAADISMCYSIASADAQGKLEGRPNCQRWMKQMRETPSFQRAMEKDGRETFVFSF